MASSAPKVKAALVTVLTSLFSAATQVSYGDLGSYQIDEVAAVLDQRVQIERPTSATYRPREEIVETTVVFSVFVGGGVDQKQYATERAYALLDILANYFLTKPNETLSGACREALVTAYDLQEMVSMHPDTEDITGQVAVLTAVVTSKARI